MSKKFIIFSISVIILAILLIVFLATGLWKNFFIPKSDENLGPIIVTPGDRGILPSSTLQSRILRDENISTKIPMQEGETVIIVFNRESEDGFPEDQFIAYIPNSASRQIHITYLSYDPSIRDYKRMWDAETAATRADTITLSSQDLIGDRNNCIIVTGMNADNEHTMTIFRRSPNAPANEPAGKPYDKIAEIQIDGSIIIQEVVRSAAYQMGITTGASFNIAAYGKDNLSNNLLDQIETTYSFNHDEGVYEQTRVTRIPGSQIEQQRLRELLSGTPGVFESFIKDLWYYVSPQGTVDLKQYLYFDPDGREIIFFGDEAQQIYSWQSSSYTNYGMYIRSRNISITTLLRFISIELESLDSIRIRVTEDVHLNIQAGTTWDGSYRRAKAAVQHESAPSVKQGISAEYDSAWGRVQFLPNGQYTITTGSPSSAALQKGHYVFFNVDDIEVLEMRAEEGSRMTYRVENTGNTLNLSRVRLGIGGVQDLYEVPVILTPVE